MSITALQLMAKFGIDTSEAEAGVGKVQGMLKMGGPLALGVAAVGAAMVGLGVVAVKMAGDFEEGMTGLVTGAGENKANLALVSSGILQMARDTGETTQQLSAGMFMIESAGHHGADGLNVLREAAEGAKVGNADLGITADALTTILKDYPHVTNGAAGAMNTLIATVSNGKTHMEDLASSLSQILPTASSAHIGLNDVMGAMATMTGEGVPAANAATYLRQTIIALVAPSKQTVDALKGIGLSSTQVANEMTKSMPAAMQMIMDAVAKKFPASAALMRAEMVKVNKGTETFDQALQTVAAQGGPAYLAALKNIAGGSKQMQGILDLTGGHMQDFQANTKAVADQVKKGGKDIVGWSDVQGDFNFKIARAKEVVETFMIALGTKLLPVAGQVVDLFTSYFVPALTLLGSVLVTTTGVISAIVGWFIRWHTPIMVAAGVITAVFLPALIKTGVESTIAGAKVAAQFVANVVKSGVESATAAGKYALYSLGLIRTGAQAVIAGARIAGSFVASMVTSGAQAVASGAKIAGSFVVSLVTSGAQAIVNAAKITASFVASMVTAGAQAVAQGARVVASFVAALVISGLQAARTGAMMLAELVPSLVTSGAAFVTMAVTSIASTISAFLAYIPVAFSAAVATIAAAAPFILVGLAILGTIAIIVLLVTHWKQIIGWLSNLGFIKAAGAAFAGLGAMVSNIGKAMGSAIKGGINAVIGDINSFIGFLDGIQIHVPSIGVGPVHTPAFNWGGLGIPNIPMLAEGGTITSPGDVIVGERGPERLALPAGAQVTPLSGAAGGQTIIIQLDGRTIAQQVVKHFPAAIRLATGARSF